MHEGNKKKPQVTVTFNGRKYTLDEWTKKQTAADREKTLDWSAAFSAAREPNEQHVQPLADPDASEEQKPERPGSAPRRSTDPLRPLRFIWLPAAAALVVGLVIGMTMLMLFSQQNTQSSHSWTGTSQAAQSDGNAKSVRTADLNISVFAIQAGLYRSENKASQIADQLRGTAPASSLQVSGGTAILIGISSTDQGAAKLLDVFKQKNLTVFKKKISIQATQKTVKDQSRASDMLSCKKMLLALLHLSDQMKSGTQGERTAALKTFDKLYKSITSTQRVKTDSFLKDVKAARQAAGELPKKSSDSQFFAFQQQLLNALVDYRALIHL